MLQGNGACAGGPLHALQYGRQQQQQQQPQLPHQQSQPPPQQQPQLPQQQPPLPGYQPCALTERQLTTAICACRTVEQLRAAVLPLGPHLNGIHACCALSQLAAIATRRPPAGAAAKSAAAAAAGAGQQRRLARETAGELAPKLIQLLPLMRPREVSTILYSWGRLGHASDDDLLAACLRRFADTAHLNTALGVGNACWGLAAAAQAGVRFFGGPAGGPPSGAAALVTAAIGAGAARLCSLVLEERRGGPKVDPRHACDLLWSAAVLGHALEPSQAAALCGHVVVLPALGGAAGGGAADANADAASPPPAAGFVSGTSAVQPLSMLWALSALRELPGWCDPFTPAQWEALAAGAISGNSPRGGARREQAARPGGAAAIADAATGLEAIARLSSGQAAMLGTVAAARCARQLLQQAVQAARDEPRRALQSPGALTAAAAVLRRSAALGAWDADGFDALAGAIAAALEAAQARAAHGPQPSPALPPAPVLARVALALCEAGHRDERLLRLLLQALGSLLATGARAGLGQSVDVCYAAASLQAPPTLAPLVQGLCQAAVLRHCGGGGGNGRWAAVPAETLRRLHAVHVWAAAAGAAAMGHAHGGGLQGFVPPELLQRCCHEAGRHEDLQLPLPALDASGCESGDDDPLPPAGGCDHDGGLGAAGGGQCGGSSCDSSSGGGSGGGGGPSSGLSSGRSSTPPPCSPAECEAVAAEAALGPAGSVQAGGAWQPWCDGISSAGMPEGCWQWQERPQEPQPEGRQRPDCPAPAAGERQQDDDGSKPAPAPSRAAAADNDSAHALDQRRTSADGAAIGDVDQPRPAQTDKPGCGGPSCQRHCQQQPRQQQQQQQQQSQPPTPPPPQPVQQHHIAAAGAVSGGGCPVHSRALSLGAASSSNWSLACGDAVHSRSASLGSVQAAHHARRPSHGSAAASSAPASPPPLSSDAAARQPAAAAGGADPAKAAGAAASPAEAAASLDALADGALAGASHRELRAAAARVGAQLFARLGCATPHELAACLAAWGRLGFVAGPQGLLEEVLRAFTAACAVAGAVAVEDLEAAMTGLGDLAEAAHDTDGGRLPAARHVVHAAAAQAAAALAAAVSGGGGEGGAAGPARAFAGARAAANALAGAAALGHRLSGAAVGPLARAAACGCGAGGSHGERAAVSLRCLCALASLQRISPRAFSAATLPPEQLLRVAEAYVAATGQAAAEAAQQAEAASKGSPTGRKEGAARAASAPDGEAVAAFGTALRQLAVAALIEPAAAERCIREAQAAISG
ncbi:hypothetical protein Rsub_02467 [Raphidocelis subcapitata]|uniref:Uncharacterized protein n=1 Tax=Raphidocelis subcapitata TaxID=307507 RepID=A0A2V0NRU9_9CHLO|nr:hypothetical protein Rsub_02467 [Raphidocelis subcapitata]|eukprot:GBF90361.1 hypothetical protein Rsub_02467 [Raphidocelis subcapitata]